MLFISTYFSLAYNQKNVCKALIVIVLIILYRLSSMPMCHVLTEQICDILFQQFTYFFENRKFNWLKRYKHYGNYATKATTTTTARLTYS